MSSLHEQAMNYVYQQVLQRLMGYLSRAERTALQLLIQRLIVGAGGIDDIANYKVLVTFSGSKDSAYTLALMRAAQLSIALRARGTFQLRVANMRHAGMASAVMANINRCYAALFMQDDPRVELLVIDHQDVHVFEHDLPFSVFGHEQQRSDILLTGHLSAADPRSTFCNTCYLCVARFFRRAASWDGGVNAVLCGESMREQKRYAIWVMRLARRHGQPIQNWQNLTFNTALSAIDSVERSYYRELYDADVALEAPTPHAQVYLARSAVPAFLTIADLVVFRAQEHLTLMTEFLGFGLDELAFSFSEPDCVNPLLMAHMRGLRAQFVEQREYADGIAQYLERAASRMRRTRMPDRLIDTVMAAYDSAAKIQERRELAGSYAQEALGLSEPQLVCMLFAPFVDSGAGLESFLRRCYPGMLVALADLHRALEGHVAPDQVSQWLVEVSGMSLQGLQSLYARPRVDFATDSSITARVWTGDPDEYHNITPDPAPQRQLRG